MTPFASNLAVRLITAGFLAPLIIAITYHAPHGAMIALTAFGTVAAGIELARMVAPKQTSLQIIAVALSLAMHGVFVSHLPETMVLASVLAVVVIGFFTGLAHVRPVDTAAIRAGWLIAAPFYLGASLATLSLLHEAPDGPGWVILAMLLAWFGDTGGYFAGKFLGKKPLLPSVSPKKTIEGSIGGLLGSTAGAILASSWFLPALPLGHALALGLVGGAFGQAGDLCESLLKRSTGVKDSGGLLPGHGGVLDRIDALLFTSSLTWCYVAILLPCLK